MLTLQVLASIVGQIINAIHIAEEIFPDKGSGKSKLETVMNKAEEVIQGAPIAIAEMEKVRDSVKPLIEGVVAVMNKTGLFETAATGTAVVVQTEAAAAAAPPMPVATATIPVDVAALPLPRRARTKKPKRSKR